MPAAKNQINVDEIIAEAKQLTDLRKEIGPKLNKARQVLTFLGETGLLTPEQDAAIQEIFSTQARIKGVRMMDPRTKKALDRPVYSKAMGEELEGQPLSDQDMAVSFGEDWRERFPNAGSEIETTEA